MPACAGTYKGLKFRSLLEYSFMKHLERTGLRLGTDVRYEHFRVPYAIGSGKQRTYLPDFYIVPQARVVEIKYSKYLDRKKEMAKFEAADAYFKKLGIEYEVYTEDDLVMAKMTLREAVTDPDVVWDKRTARQIKRKKI